MNTKKRDVKFIIYQALYIFIICVVAIKGANIDLAEVDEKKMIEPGWTYVDTTNKILIDRNEYAKLIPFDSTKFLIVSKEDYSKDPSKYPPPVVISPAGDPIKLIPIIDDRVRPEPEKKVDKEIVIGNVELFQWHQNSVNNQGDNAITINGTTIPAHSTGRVVLGGEQSVVIQAGDKTKSVAVKENKKPQIGFQRMTSMGDDAKVTNLQRNIGYRVTITDDFPDQLDVKFGGAVTVKQVSATTFDVTLNAFSSRTVFENFTDNNQSPYKVGFTVSVKDKLAPHSVTGQNVFVFGGW